MIDPNQIETILRMNGASPASDEEQIRSVLLSARYDANDVDTAIMVLRNNVQNGQSRVDGLHRVFRTDEALRPEEINNLLGINIDINTQITQTRHSSAVSGPHFLIVWLFSVLLATSAMIGYMYLADIGMFYTPPSLDESS